MSISFQNGDNIVLFEAKAAVLPEVFVIGATQ